SLKSLGEKLVTTFVGYGSLEAESDILALLDAGGAPAESVGEGGEGFLVAAETPFYAESGGQAADAGVITTAPGEARVTAVLKAGRAIVQRIAVTRGEIHADQKATLRVDADQRLATARNHTCTHLLHAALRRVLGEHVKQSGSLVDGQRLRFDFSHLAALTPEELAAVERDVNRVIMADLPVTAREMPRDEALAAGAMALFSEKYGEVVRVLSVGAEGAAPESVELCGGTHLSRTGEAGLFLIVAESGVAAGVRRIEAVTGWNAYGQAIGQRAELGAVAAALKTSPGQAAERLHAVQDELKKLRRAVEKGATASVDGAELARRAEKVGAVTLVAQRLDGVPVKALRDLMDDVRSRLQGPAVACLAGVADGKVSLLLYVSKDLHDRLTAPALIKEVAAPCGGSGGGRPDLAQAGGTRPEGLEEAFAALRALVEGNK
ncbi:MAG: alanine--tRNA ligase, partial [Desulfovibrio sp.]|nr:alanine--tRNA ligase [Desulfovibrio sp.]